MLDNSYSTVVSFNKPVVMIGNEVETYDLHPYGLKDSFLEPVIAASLLQNARPSVDRTLRPECRALTWVLG